MASGPSQPSKLFAHDIVHFSDAELDQYLEVNGRLVDVEDPENLPEEFIQRLRVRAGAPDTTQSRPIDFDKVTTRLAQIPVDREERSPSLATTEDLGEEEYYRLDLVNETEYYDTLIREGGRPSHPVSLGMDILKDSGEYREILSYWQLDNGDAENRKWKLFKSQMVDWQEFLEYQRNNRQEGQFSVYVNELKITFAKYEFTRLYQLDEDLEQQDKLTTWIEFLGHKYRIYDRYMTRVRLRQSIYDEAWRKLVDSQVLRLNETEKFICDVESAFERFGDVSLAERGVKAWESVVTSTQKAITDLRRSGLFNPKLLRKLSAAETNLDAAVTQLESIDRRNTLISEFHQKTKSYQISKDNADRRSILLRWILKQIPIIELEMNPAEAANNGTNEQKDRKRTSKRNRAEERTEERVSKRQRQDVEGNSVSNRSTRVCTAKEREALRERSPPTPLKEGRASRDHRASVSKSVKPRSIPCPALKMTKSVARGPAKQITEGKARVVKTGSGGEKPRKLPALDSSPRRSSTRTRKPPDRFY